MEVTEGKFEPPLYKNEMGLSFREGSSPTENTLKSVFSGEVCVHLCSQVKSDQSFIP